MERSPRIAVIVLNWRGLEDTRECCKSLTAVTYPNMRVYVVDNGSGDGSGAILAQEFPQFTHVSHERNLGFTGGNNALMQRALQDGADYVLMLNNDTVVAPDFLTKMVQAAETDRQIGMVGARIYFHSDPNIIWFGGGSVDFNRWYPFSHVGEGDTDSNFYAGARETSFLTGCCLLVRKVVIEQVGMLDECFAYYCEDVDWCLRVRRAGWKLWYEGGARVWHKINRSTSQIGVNLGYYSNRNAILAMRRMLGDNAKYLIVKAAWKTVTGPGFAKESKIHAIRGVWHGITREIGHATPMRHRWLWAGIASIGDGVRKVRERFRPQHTVR